MTTVIPHVRLLIERDDTTTLCVDVPAYEQPVLEAPYPEGAVQELEYYAVEVPDFDVTEAFERLAAKYAGHADTHAARIRKFERARDLKAWIEERQPKAETKTESKSKKEADKA